MRRAIICLTAIATAIVLCASLTPAQHGGGGGGASGGRPSGGSGGNHFNRVGSGGKVGGMKSGGKKGGAAKGGTKVGRKVGTKVGSKAGTKGASAGTTAKGGKSKTSKKYRSFAANTGASSQNNRGLPPANGPGWITGQSANLVSATGQSANLAGAAGQSANLATGTPYAQPSSPVQAPGRPAGNRQDRRYLRIRNDTGVGLTVFLQYQTLSLSKGWKWYPTMPGGAAKAVSFRFAPNAEGHLRHEDWPVSAVRVRVWGRTTDGEDVAEYRDQDLWLVEANDGERCYFAPRPETFTFAFGKADNSP